jgi:hypothetical protein
LSDIGHAGISVIGDSAGEDAVFFCGVRVEEAVCLSLSPEAFNSLFSRWCLIYISSVHAALNFYNYLTLLKCSCMDSNLSHFEKKNLFHFYKTNEPPHLDALALDRAWNNESFQATTYMDLH